ncbi:MAG: YicC family protein [Candidatus Cloacimonadota bacterium]|nr:MAG: YicC family protein [Candidatus Cloacimonadota bacterium]
MIKSMTGFGTSKTTLPSGEVLCCNIKTLNHKYLDIHITLPNKLKPYEPEIMKELKNSFMRGRVEASFYFEPNKPNLQKSDIDFQKAEEYYNLLLNLKKKFNVKGDVDIALLSRFSDIFVKKDIAELPDKALLDLLKIVHCDSIDKVKDMRMKEGKEIYKDFKKMLRNMKKNLAKIKVKAEKNISLCRKRIRKILNLVKGEVNINESRLEQETLLYAIKSDIMEECTRLENHISQFETSLEVNEAAGKKLNFLLQEMAREVNTLCAKAQSGDIQKRGIQIKEEIEHLKEQVYNIE